MFIPSFYKRSVTVRNSSAVLSKHVYVTHGSVSKAIQRKQRLKQKAIVVTFTGRKEMWFWVPWNKIHGKRSMAIARDHINERRIYHFTAAIVFPTRSTGEKVKKWGHVKDLEATAGWGGCAPSESFVAGCERQTSAHTYHPPHQNVEEVAEQKRRQRPVVYDLGWLWVVSLLRQID